jgi:hypothetical protein
MIHDQPELGIERHRDLAVSRGDPEHRPARGVHDDRPRSVRHVPAHRPPAERERSHRPVAERVAIMLSRTGRSTCWDSAHSVARGPPTVRPGDHQPDGADHEEQRDEVM